MYTTGYCANEGVVFCLDWRQLQLFCYAIEIIRALCPSIPAAGRGVYTSVPVYYDSWAAAIAWILTSARVETSFLLGAVSLGWWFAWSSSLLAAKLISMSRECRWDARVLGESWSSPIFIGSSSVWLQRSIRVGAERYSIKSRIAIAHM